MKKIRAAIAKALGQNAEGLPMTTIFTSDSTQPVATQPVGLGAMTGSVGPKHCAVCGEWPARQTERGNRCHLCESREWCEEHPVPLPSNRKMLEDLASIGVPGAAEKPERTR